MNIVGIFFALALALVGSVMAQERIVESAPTSLVEDGRQVSLELVLFKPSGNGPFPALVFNHGSVGNGNDPAEVTHTVTYPALASFFNARGWLVVFPQRRGRGKSDGRYAEGWEAHRGRYTCDPAVSLAGLTHALQDLDEVVKAVSARPWVNPKRLMIGGHSKGAILSMAYAAEHPERFMGVVNFVGGWVGERCETSRQINGATFATAAKFPGRTLWLYGENDAIYSMSHSRENFERFTSAGGQGSFHALSPGFLKNGHQLVRMREIWDATMASFLESLNEETFSPVLPGASSPK